MGISISRGEIEVVIAEFKKNLENCRIWKNMQMVGGNLINYFDLYSMPLWYGLFVGKRKGGFFFVRPFPCLCHVSISPVLCLLDCPSHL